MNVQNKILSYMKVTSGEVVLRCEMFSVNSVDASRVGVAFLIHGWKIKDAEETSSDCGEETAVATNSQSERSL